MVHCNYRLECLTRFDETKKKTDPKEKKTIIFILMKLGVVLLLEN